MTKVKDIETNSLMNWETAIHDLEFDGKHIRRRVWPEGSYLDIQDDGVRIFFALCNTSPKIKSEKYLPSDDDAIALDWEYFILSEKTIIPNEKPYAFEMVSVKKMADERNCERKEQILGELSLHRVPDEFLTEKIKELGEFHRQLLTPPNELQLSDEDSLIRLSTNKKSYLDGWELARSGRDNKVQWGEEEIFAHSPFGEEYVYTTSHFDQNDSFIKGFADSNLLLDIRDILNKKEGDSKANLSGNLPIDALAIMHVYLAKHGGQPITENNKVSIAHKNKPGGSGTNLRNRFTHYQNDGNRTRLDPDKRRSARTHKSYFEEILPLLQNTNPQAYIEALADYQKIQKKYEELHQ